MSAMGQLEHGADAAMCAVRACWLMSGCIAISYAIWVWEGYPAWLPSISQTWVIPPANYISRFMIGNGCDVFFICNLFLYSFSKRDCGTTVKPELLLSMAGGAILCLSWVAAVCESDTAVSCMGNNALHTQLAETFFWLYDLRMLLGAYVTLTREKGGVWRKWSSVLLAVVSVLLSAVRSSPAFLDLSHLGIGSNIVPAAERINVWIITLWTVNEVGIAATAERFGYGAVEMSSQASGKTGNVEVLAYLTTKQMANLVVAFYVTLLFLSSLIGLYLGYLPKVPGQFWFISDMWTLPPNNWLSRWTAVQGAHWAGWVQYSLYLASLKNSRGPADTAKSRNLFGLSLIALFGLSVVGICSEIENLTIHCVGAFLYIGGYDLYMLVTIRSEAQASTPKEAALESSRLHFLKFLRTRFALLAFGCQALLLFDRLGVALKLAGTIAALLEWTDALCIIAFFWLDVQIQTEVVSVVNGVYVLPEGQTSLNGNKYVPLVDQDASSDVSV